METFIIKPKYYILLAIPLVLVYILGLPVLLMDQDPSHHADIALHMYLTGNYIDLISNGSDYLDKPHLLFWLTALFYHVFGVTTIAYKLPSVLITCLGVYSTYKLGKLLYTEETGILAALITASSQAFILANNDVRMDALLTGLIIFATWQLSAAIYRDKWYNYVLGALGMALAFSTKGMIGIIMPAFAILFLLLYQRNWSKLFNRVWIFVFFLLLIFISPELYCYYIQFDLHPEKVIRGTSNISGLKFILWGQSVERLDGSNFGKKNGDPLFFLHTLLWAFYPWALIAYYAIFSKLSFFFKTRLRYIREAELLTLGTTIVILIVISSSNFQLPHYLNILFPFLGIITAHQLLGLHSSVNGQRVLTIILKLQFVVASFCVLLAVLLNTWAFPVKSIWIILAAFLLLILLSFEIFKQSENYLKRIVVISILGISFANVLLNGNFYPSLLKYQSGPAVAEFLVERKINLDSIYKFNINSYSLDFYTKKLIPTLNITELYERIKESSYIWIYTNEDGVIQLLQANIDINALYTYPNSRVSKLKLKFLNPATRHKACYTTYLIRIEKRGRVLRANTATN